MRYHLESYLPVEAFKPRGGVGGMTLHGSSVVSAITDPISNALGTAGGQSGVLGALADFDDAVATSVDGGWAGLAEEAAVMVATAYGGPAGGGAARAGFEYTHGGERRKNAVRTGAEQAAVDYVGGDLGGGPIGAGATKAGLQYTHGGEDRKNAGKSGLTTAGTRFAGQGVKDYLFSSNTDAPITDNSDFTYSPDYSPDYVPPPDMDLDAPYNDGYSPNQNTDYIKIPGEPGFNMIPADSFFLGQTPTSFIPTDMSVGTQFEGPNGPEIVAPNGKTYLMRDLDKAFFDLSNPQAVPFDSPTLDKGINSDNFLQNVKLDARPYISDYDPQISAFQPVDSNQALQSQYEAQDVMQQARSGDIPQGTSGSVYNPARPGFFQDPLQNISNRASDALNYVKNAPEKTYDYFTDPDRTISDMGSDLYKSIKANPLEYGIGALALSRMGGQKPQPQGQPAGSSSGYGPYTGGYGSSGGVADPYLLRNRVNASNIYNYRNPNTSRYAEGGEVKHFAYGGISNAVTRLTQPIEKAIVQPVGQALPFLRDAAPYAGILAAPFITSPFAAAGVGALSSGFGRPGSGFDMKRALMGGIAAYGASTVGAGLEAAGTEPTKPLVDTIGESYAVPGTEVPASTAATKGFFRDTDAMQKGVGNLLSSDSDAAIARFGTKAGTFKSGIPIVMGTSGVMAIDEANKMREESDRAAAVGKQEQADMLARISKGRKRAEEAVRENPYMYAMGGSVDDELGGDYSAMGMDQGNLQKGLFGLGYAEGGVAKKPISYKNTDIKNELNMPTGKSVQELEGSLPIDNAYLIAKLRAMRGIPNEGIVEQGIGANIPIGNSRLNAMVNQDRMMNRRYELGGNTPFLGGELSGMMSKTEGRDPMFNIGYKKQFAEGGTPRFLSGGGDGMSDSIPATIGGTQEARLADGEFVIPADVVSHLGNGSSKAGAKQLYSMMDRIRKARTGNEKQGRQIKPKKMMPA